jgi:DNA-binding GntR family transcriptional regulator
MSDRLSAARGGRGFPHRNGRSLEDVSHWDWAYGGLRQRILKGSLRPNQRLVEAELADALELSQTPIREILQRLEQEDLVESTRRGWIVREHSQDEIKDIYEARAALEGYAARLAAERAVDHELQTIKSINSRRGATLRETLLKYNDGFHRAVVQASHNLRLLQLFQSNHEYYFNYRTARLYSEEESSVSLEGHSVIVDALMRRDSDAAEDAMRYHIMFAYEVLQTKIA